MYDIIGSICRKDVSMLFLQSTVYKIIIYIIYIIYIKFIIVLIYIFFFDSSMPPDVIIHLLIHLLYIFCFYFVV